MSVSVTKIQRNKRLKFREMVSYVARNFTNGDLNRASGLVYASETFKLLQRPEQEYWTKSVSEFQYLISCELSGNRDAWLKQVDSAVYAKSMRGAH